MNEDTIIALSTPPFAGFKSLIRVSGIKSHQIISKLSKIKLDELEKFPIVKTCDIQLEEDFAIKCDVFFYKEPHSYTGEDVCEIILPGSVPIIQKFIEILIQEGTRHAQPGEFTKRAFLNEKIDLSQAESVLQLIKSVDAEEIQVALKQLKGSLSKLVNSLRQKLIDTLTFCEAQLDFSDQEIEVISTEQIGNVLTEVYKKLVEISQGKKEIHESAIQKVILIGQTNVGKSSIFNEIIKGRKVIVSSIQGTTRDYIAESFSFQNQNFMLVDTAGKMERPDAIAKLSSEKTDIIIQEADIIAFVIDSSSEDFDFDINLLKNINTKNVIILLNKIDLISSRERLLIKERFSKMAETVLVSAKTGEGIEDFMKAVYKVVKFQKVERHSSEFIINARHIGYIKRAIKSLEDARDSLNSGLSLEFVVCDIQQVIKHLEDLVGKVYTEDVLNNIFANFCIGK